jgi:hypothetical protein
MEAILNQTIDLLSKAINFLKRALVLGTLLFLIENLINFWVLTSAYSFLDIPIPAYFQDTISTIYNLYNESFFSYLGINISYPDLTVLNSNYQGLPNSSNYSFNFCQFALEPAILIALTIVELSFVKWLIKNIKNRVRKQREEYVQIAISKQVAKVQGN